MLDFIITKTFLCMCITVPVYLILEYIFGFFVRVKEFIAAIAAITPNPNFLSDVAAVEAMMIAIAIPLSFDIVSRISERYQSEVVIRQFEQGRVNGWLPIALILNILLAILLRFFMIDHPISFGWKILAWATFFLFLLITITFVMFIRRLRRYMTDTRFIMDELFDDAETSIR